MDLIEKQINVAKKKAEALFYCTTYSPQKIAMLSGADEDEVLHWIFGSGAISHTQNKDCWFYRKEILGIEMIGGSAFREIEPLLIETTKASTLQVILNQLEAICISDLMAIS